MIQYGAGDLATNYGFSYKDILNHYYTNASLVDMDTVAGVERNIKVGLTKPNGSLEHGQIFITGGGKLRVYAEDESFDYTFDPNTEIRITPKAGRLYVKTKVKEFWTDKKFLWMVEDTIFWLKISEKLIRAIPDIVEKFSLFLREMFYI